jgi:dolichyl-diphosphooligosaccharide--protein glycosyltransferase/undecaprenyl-diphosphooligosaccharide--protein glycosyltransferase
VYAVPVAAMSAVYLFFVIGEFFSDKRAKYAFVTLATIAMIYPNITHIIAYKVPTVLNKSEVEDLVKLDKMASDKDYTLAWWDYGYPIWYYSDTNTLIDGGKHNNDNFIISKIMQTQSPRLAANLSRLAVEKYVDTNYSVITKSLFPKEKSPNLFLKELESKTFTSPAKTRDIYLYLPYKMLTIFPTVALFGNLDLETGQPLRKIVFYPSMVVGKQGSLLRFNNGINFDVKRGILQFGSAEQKIRYFVVTQNQQDSHIKVQAQKYHRNAPFVVVYMKSYEKFVIMDTETFNSIYVQMFILGQYDHSLFELVVSSPYSRIYKLKI